MKSANVSATHTRYEGDGYVNRRELADWLDDRIREHTRYDGDYVTKRERTVYIQCLAYLKQMEIYE